MFYDSAFIENNIMYNSSWIVNKYPSLIVVAAWIDKYIEEGLNINAPHSQHLLNRPSRPIILLNIEGQKLALESPLKDYLRFKSFSYSQNDIPENNDFQFRIRYTGVELEHVKEAIMNDKFHHYMLGIFFDNMPPLTDLKQAKGILEIMSTNLNAKHIISGLPEELKEGVNAAAHLITEKALIGNLVDTQSKFEFPGLVGTFFWTKDGLSVSFSSYNQKQRAAAISSINNDLTLSRTGYAKILEKYLLNGYPQMNTLIPLYTFKLEKLATAS